MIYSPAKPIGALSFFGCGPLLWTAVDLVVKMEPRV